MPERTSYEPGTPSWADLSSPDMESTKRFYGELFGWEAQEAGPVEQTGGYTFFTLRGKRVAGVGPIMAEGQPPVWTTYFSTDSADEVANRSREQGAHVVVDPMDVMDAGRMTIVSHPAAGFFGAWQPGQHRGAELVNEPGTMTWNELLTRDPVGARRFLEAVFGLRAEDTDMGGGIMYTVLYVGDRGVAGMMGMPRGIPAQVPAFWNVYFAVEDTDATATRAVELGGTQIAEPMDIPGIGRFAGLTDPHGANFSVIKNEGEAR
jgi:predicted enzyme related to lactoylglutathione lyase